MAKLSEYWIFHQLFIHYKVGSSGNIKELSILDNSPVCLSDTDTTGLRIVWKFEIIKIIVFKIRWCEILFTTKKHCVD